MIAWFICQYKRDEQHPNEHLRYCAMDDFTPLIYGEGGQWSETEILGNYALVKVRASETTINAIAATVGFFRFPLDRLDDSLGSLSQQMLLNIRNRILAMGYTIEEIQELLPSDWREITFRQVAKFVTRRRLKPRYDYATDEIVLDGVEQACRPLEDVDLDVL